MAAIIHKIVNAVCSNSSSVNVNGYIVNIKFFNVSKINKHDKITDKICEDLIRSKLKRRELLEGTFSNPIYQNKNSREIDEDEFVEFIENYYNNNTNIYQFLESTYEDLSKGIQTAKLSSVLS